MGHHSASHYAIWRSTLHYAIWQSPLNYAIWRSSLYYAIYRTSLHYATWRSVFIIILRHLAVAIISYHFVEKVTSPGDQRALLTQHEYCFLLITVLVSAEYKTCHSCSGKRITSLPLPGRFTRAIFVFLQCVYGIISTKVGDALHHTGLHLSRRHCGRPSPCHYRDPPTESL